MKRILILLVAALIAVPAYAKQNKFFTPQKSRGGPYFVEIVEPVDPVINPAVFPAFTKTRSDYIRPEGTESLPLVIAPVPCTILPIVDWQTTFCSEPIPTVYEKSNWFSHTDDVYNSWIISFNNEFLMTPGCNDGPPNVSRSADGRPFAVSSGYGALTLAVTHVSVNDNCDKIPYLSATYIRGVQAGDPVKQIFTWDEAKGKTIEVDLVISMTPTPESKTPDQLQWLEVYLHFKDLETGRRYMIKTDLISPQEYGDMYINWNWPFVNSFQYPGAVIGINAASFEKNIPLGRNKISLDIHAIGLKMFPEFAKTKPVFLGAEFAVESAFGPFQTVLTLNKVEFK